LASQKKILKADSTCFSTYRKCCNDEKADKAPVNVSFHLTMRRSNWTHVQKHKQSFVWCSTSIFCQQISSQYNNLNVLQ